MLFAENSQYFYKNEKIRSKRQEIARRFPKFVYVSR